MESKHTELGFLASAVLAAGFMSSPAYAQTTPPISNNFRLSPDQMRAPDPSVAVKVFPFPLTGRSFSEAARKDRPQVDILLPNKNYYEQKDNHSVDLAPGVTGKMKGPMRVRVTVAF